MTTTQPGRYIVGGHTYIATSDEGVTALELAIRAEASLTRDTRARDRLISDALSKGLIRQVA